jgi:hypothetical protein
MPIRESAYRADLRSSRASEAMKAKRREDEGDEVMRAQSESRPAHAHLASAGRPSAKPIVLILIVLSLVSAPACVSQPDPNASVPDAASALLASIRLGAHQEIVYCDTRDRIVLRSGDVAHFSCRGDSMILNGHTVRVEPFPSSNICDLALIKYLFGRAPRVLTLLAKSGGVTADSAAWRLAVARYCSEFHQIPFAAPDSLIGAPLPDERARSGALVNMWNLLDLGDSCFQVHTGAQLRCDLAGVPISGGPPDGFCCEDAKVLAHYLSGVVESGRPFHAELGPALLIWSDKWSR